MMGLGDAMYEEMVYGDGQLLNGDSFQYRLPLLHDLPPRFTSIMVENHDGPGPLGAKGMSQTAVSPIAPAIANAIYDAVGVRIKHSPSRQRRCCVVWGSWPNEESTMLKPLRVYQPTSVTEASAELARLGEDAKVYAGGTEIILLLRLGLVHYPHLVDVKKIPAGRAGVGWEDDAHRCCRHPSPPGEVGRRCRAPAVAATGHGAGGKRARAQRRHARRQPLLR